MKIKATVEGIQFELDSTVLSRSEREEVISSLIRPLCVERLAPVDRLQRERLIEGMALEPDLRFKLGKQVVESLPAENPDSAAWGVKLLIASDLSEAIAPLTKLLEYEASWDHRSCADGVHDLALSALRKFVANKREFRHEAARMALARLPQQQGDFYRDLMKTWAIELLVGLTHHNWVERDWARGQLRDLVGTDIV